MNMNIPRRDSTWLPPAAPRLPMWLCQSHRLQGQTVPWTRNWSRWRSTFLTLPCFVHKHSCINSGDATTEQNFSSSSSRMITYWGNPSIYSHDTDWYMGNCQVSAINSNCNAMFLVFLVVFEYTTGPDNWQNTCNTEKEAMSKVDSWSERRGKIYEPKAELCSKSSL